MPKALPVYERVDVHERSDLVDTGRPGRRIDMSCCHWMMGDRAKAIELMREMVDGILDRSIEFGDAAGGVQQGLLLHYMGVTANDKSAVSKARSYLRSRAKRSAIELFPGPVARYYLGEIEFPDVLAAATKDKARDVAEAIQVARTDLRCRRELCVAIFHDGVKARAQGSEQHCQTRMRECFSLENPIIEAEWYLARYEIEHGDKVTGAMK